MSKENEADHPHNELNNFKNEYQRFDISHSSKNLNSTDKLNFSNTHEKNNFETSIMLTSTDDTSHKKIIGTNIVHSSSQVNKAECKFLIKTINSNETNLNSQDENLLYEVVKKMTGNIFNTNTDLSDLNTQQFMELNLKGACQRLNTFSPTLDLNSSKTHTIEQINSDNSTIISPLSLGNELKNSEIINKNSIIVNNLNKSEKINDPSPKIDLELSIRDHNVEYPVEDQDADIIAFRAMCETLLKIGAVDNNIIDNNKTIVMKNNQLNKHIVNHQVNHTVTSCSNSIEDEPSTSKLNSFKGDISKRLGHKRKQINDLRFDLSNDSSPECSIKLSSKHYSSKRKISKMTFSQDNLKIKSKGYSDTTLIQPNNSKKIKLSDLTFEAKEVDSMLIKNKLPKVQNVINDLKCKKINDDDKLKENRNIFFFKKSGKVHQDMLISIGEKNCHSV